MNINRAPKGIPTGGQFAASTRAEPSVTLPGYYDIPARPRSIGFGGGGRQIMNWDTNEPVAYDSLTDEERVKVRQTAKDHGFPDPRRAGLREKAEKVSDRISERVEEITETVDALGEVTGHIVDIQRGEVTPEVEGSFVGWGQMLPKFMRRKDREAKVTEPEQESAEARNRRLAEVFGDAARAAERMDSASSRMRDLSGDR